MPTPVQGPGISPIPEEPGKGGAKPQIGEGQNEQKSFSMPSGAGQAATPSPMDVARDAGQRGGTVSPEELNQKLDKAHDALAQAQQKLASPDIQRGMTEEHYRALEQVSGKMNGDLRQIAQNSEQSYTPPQPVAGENAAQKVAKWINGSQKTLTGALNYLSKTKNPNPASYMKMQYAVQRATQRAELFSSIVGSSVSGLKTIMSTQLG